jgi:hypothetical protein
MSNPEQNTNFAATIPSQPVSDRQPEFAENDQQPEDITRVPIVETGNSVSFGL